MNQQHDFPRAVARRMILLFAGAIVLSMGSLAATAADKVPPDYVRQIAPIFQKHCVGCHNADDAEGKLSLD